MRGDGGQTGLAGGIRVSKASERVDTYGTTDELKTVLGLARSLCPDKEISEWTKTIQRTLFRVGSALATPPESRKTPPVISQEDIEALETMLRSREDIDTLMSARASAAFHIGRAVCVRAQRKVVRFIESGAIIQPTILPWLERLAEVLDHFSARLSSEDGAQ